ncbi:MAG: UDP-3-O-(3-hydroxymyristoyl)glucosamine N-acyltransferase [Candidatus Omnitrophota bacterium]
MITVDGAAKLIGGTVIGDGNVRVRGLSSPEYAGDGDVTFAFDEGGLKKAGESGASCVVAMCSAENYPKTILQVGDMKLAVTLLYNLMMEAEAPKTGSIHPTAIIASTAEVGKNVTAGPNAVIGERTRIGDNTVIGANCVIYDDVTIGEKTRLYSNVTVREHTRIGRKVIIHPGAVIGADGFGFVRKAGKTYKVPQMGNVVIGDDVEIGANTCVDRGAFASTVIAKGTKIDNLVQIGHNVKIGRNVLIAGQTGISGSVTVGENTMMGGQSGIVDHVTIGANVKIGAKTGVIGNVKDGETVFGYPYRNAAEFKKYMPCSHFF